CCDDEESKSADVIIRGVSIMRIQNITEGDAIAAGIGQGFQLSAEWPDYEHIDARGFCTLTQDSARMSFSSYWDSRYADRRDLRWKSNPWAWRIAVECEELEGTR